MKSVGDMVRSMLVIIAIVVGIVLLVPRPNAVVAPGVDVGQAAAGLAGRLGFTPSVPVGLPKGWTATSAGLRQGLDGVPTWHVGYVTAEGRYVGVEQAARATEMWENVLDNGGELIDHVSVAGHEWERRLNGERAITSITLHQPGLVTLLTSKAGGLSDITVLAQALHLPAG